MRRFRMMICALLCLAGLGPTPLPAGVARVSHAAEAPAHPLDGPDVDLRIRIDERGVHMSIIMNLAFVDEIIDVARADTQRLDPSEYEAVRLALLDLYRDQNEVLIDGLAIRPQEAAFEVDPGDLALLPHFPALGARALIKVRLALLYPAAAPPESVALTWGPYPADAILAGPTGAPPMEVLAQLRAEGRDHAIKFSQSEPQHIWHGTGLSIVERFAAVPATQKAHSIALPWLSMLLTAILLTGAGCARLSGHWRTLRGRVYGASALLAIAALATGSVSYQWSPGGAPLPDERSALAIFTPLHANIYHAFDYTAESDVYDALECSVHGELLAELYAEIYESLIMQEEGGALSRVEEVRLCETEVLEIGRSDLDQRPFFRVRSRWQVDGAIYHWGHGHKRTGEYRAEYMVSAREQGWRIGASRVLERRRIARPVLPGMPIFPERANGEDR